MGDRPNQLEIAAAEHIGPAHTGDNVDAKKVAIYNWDNTSQEWFRSSAAATMIQSPYDYVSITYNSTANVYQFYLGGSGGTLVGTITLQYSDSTKSQLNTVART